MIKNKHLALVKILKKHTHLAWTWIQIRGYIREYKKYDNWLLSDIDIVAELMKK